jgi:GIY-YIG catalytic domain
MQRKSSRQSKKTSNRSVESPAPNTKPVQLAADVEAIRKEIRAFLQTKDVNGKSIGSSAFGIYAFYDYDGEPIYVGKTYEGLSSRIGRHLTNQRTDAVAMNVLDPFEVAEIRVWPLNFRKLEKREALELLAQAEYTVYQKLLRESKLYAVLNEKPPPTAAPFKLPKDYRGRIIPDDIYPGRKHPDIRIARRANTIASLARVISERKVSKGLRRTLVTQARRLEKLAAERLKDFAGKSDEEADDE